MIHTLASLIYKDAVDVFNQRDSHNDIQVSSYLNQRTLNYIIICDKCAERRISFVNFRLVIIAMEMISTATWARIAFLLLITESIRSPR